MKIINSKFDRIFYENYKDLSETILRFVANLLGMEVPICYICNSTENLIEHHYYYVRKFLKKTYDSRDTNEKIKQKLEILDEIDSHPDIMMILCQECNKEMEKYVKMCDMPIKFPKGIIDEFTDKFNEIKMSFRHLIEEAEWDGYDDEMDSRKNVLCFKLKKLSRKLETVILSINRRRKHLEDEALCSMWQLENDIREMADNPPIHYVNHPPVDWDKLGKVMHEYMDEFRKFARSIDMGDDGVGLQKSK